MEVVRILRESGVRADKDLKERPLRQRMEYAAAIKARLVVVGGPREINENNVRLRDTKTGQGKRYRKK